MLAHASSTGTLACAIVKTIED